MSHEPIRSRSMQAWLAVAMFAPLAHYSGGAWPALLVLSLTAIGVKGLVQGCVDSAFRSKILCLIELVWIWILAGHYLALSADYWPGAESDWVVPGILLLLAAYGSTGRPDRSAGVLCWCLVLLLVPFALAAVKDAQPQWIIPEKLQCSAWIIPIVLLPIAGIWCSDGEQKGTMAWLPYVLGLSTWCATSAVLSPKVAMGLQTPFRSLSRSLTLGAGSRFESLASVAITLGWFALASFFLKLATGYLERFHIKDSLIPWVAVIPMILLSCLGVQWNPLFSAGMTLVLWVLVPILHGRKNLKKSEKSA